MIFFANVEIMDNSLCTAIATNNFMLLEQLINDNPNQIKAAKFSLSSLINSDYNKNNFVLSLDDLTLMHIAAFVNSTECAILLYSKGFSFSMPNARGHKPFHYACYGGAYEMVNLILSEDKDGVEELFQKDYSDSEARRINLPYLAALSGSYEILNCLFENGYNYDKYTSNQYKTLGINHTINTKNIECLKIFLKYIKPTKTYAQHTPLMQAVINNQTQAIVLLLETDCMIKQMTDKFETALSLACLNENEDAVRLIADKIIDDIDIPKDKKAPGATHWACYSCNPHIVEIILNRDININRFDQHGHTGPYYLLDRGTEDNTIRILEMYVKRGYDINLHDKNKNTIFGEFLIAIKKCYKIYEWFLSHGADTSCYLYTKTRDKQTIGAYMRTLARFDKRMKNLVTRFNITRTEE